MGDLLAPQPVKEQREPAGDRGGRTVVGHRSMVAVAAAARKPAAVGGSAAHDPAVTITTIIVTATDEYLWEAHLQGLLRVASGDDGAVLQLEDVPDD